MVGIQAVTHLKVYVGVEYLCPEAHGWRLQRVLLRHVERQLKRAALKRRVRGPLHVKGVRQVVKLKRSTRVLEGSCLIRCCQNWTQLALKQDVHEEMSCSLPEAESAPSRTPSRAGCCLR